LMHSGVDQLCGRNFLLLKFELFHKFKLIFN
jgi:hypothetical protein